MRAGVAVAVPGRYGYMYSSLLHRKQLLLQCSRLWPAIHVLEVSEWTGFGARTYESAVSGLIYER